MSNVAIGVDGEEHYADNTKDTYVGEYRCPNPRCLVPMTLKNIGSDLKAYGTRRPYFSASRSAPHVEGCSYSNTCICYEELQKTGFCADDFFHQIQKGHSVVTRPAADTDTTVISPNTRNAITTLNKLYHFCLQHRDEDTLPDGTKIFEIYQENRNKHIPNLRRHTARLVKLRFRNCNFLNYDADKECYKIWCMFPHTEKEKPPGQFYTLGFRKGQPRLLMDYFCDILTPMKQTHEDVFILVGGEWQGNHCDITSKRQIFILPHNSK